MKTDYQLTSPDNLTALLVSRGINSWNQLTHYIRSLPYGRNANRTDLQLVIEEGKGTCSSKHALLKKLADLNNVPNVKLVLEIYKMTASNTPKVQEALKEHSIDFIPEAHCYLKIEGEAVDLTSATSDFEKIAADVIEEKPIQPEQVASFKVDYHQDFLKRWLADTNSGHNFEQIWKVREQCISLLAE